MVQCECTKLYDANDNYCCPFCGSINMREKRMNPTIHFVKCWPQFFERVLDGSKTFEYRSNDRGYQKGDVVVLQEWDPSKMEPQMRVKQNGDLDVLGLPAQEKGYTGREARFTIGYVLPINEHAVVLSITALEKK